MKTFLNTPPTSFCYIFRKNTRRQMKQLIYFKIYAFTLDYLVKGFSATYVVELMSSCLVFGAGTACRPHHSLQATPQQRWTALLCPVFLLKKICPRTEERPKPLGHSKSPQRLTVSKSLDNLNKGRIILWGCIFGSLEPTVKLSQLRRS